MRWGVTSWQCSFFPNNFVRLLCLCNGVRELVWRVHDIPSMSFLNQSVFQERFDFFEAGVIAWSSIQFTISTCAWLTFGLLWPYWPNPNLLFLNCPRQRLLCVCVCRYFTMWNGVGGDTDWAWFTATGQVDKVLRRRFQQWRQWLGRWWRHVDHFNSRDADGRLADGREPAANWASTNRRVCRHLKFCGMTASWYFVIPNSTNMMGGMLQ